MDLVAESRERFKRLLDGLLLAEGKHLDVLFHSVAASAEVAGDVPGSRIVPLAVALQLA